ncbi:transglutaminase-like domain-containing protein [Ruminococcus sp.]|uniref:transglutaminase-like domain-containing protein n=1 Tax=Ruminococcus sp. TaxID=41978 RepID=UPI0025F39C8A|nr:transglutaminase-like domain-containing protein [Ruminococcus sp.]
MHNKQFLKATAFVLAAVLMCTSCSTAAQKTKKDIADDKLSKSRHIAAEVVSEEERWSLEEQLAYASKGNDDTQLIMICNRLIDELDEAKKSIDEDAAEINQWASGEILQRQKAYEAMMNAKYEETLQAVSNLKNGINAEENIRIISDNLSPEEDLHCTYAAANSPFWAAAAEMTEDYKVKEAKMVISDPTEEDLSFEKDMISAEAAKNAADAIGDIDDIYYFVKNCIRNEMYTGSKKGPLHTLNQMGGNDTDQASLLISLLRAKQVPARFVRGTVRITLQQGLELTGASDPDTALSIIAASYRKPVAITKDDKITAYRFEHTWVEAYVPYTDYRGAGNKSGESVWIQLDPSFKKLVQTDAEIEPSYTEDQLACFAEMQEIAKNSSGKYTLAHDPSDKINIKYYDIAAKNEIYLPSSLPYKVESVSEQYNFIKGADKQTISISIDEEKLFETPVAELYGQFINITYEPASESDKATMEKYEKITDVPTHLVKVVPVVTVGSQKFRAKHSCNLGTVQNMKTVVNDDTSAAIGATVLNDVILSGSVYAVNVDLNTISYNESKYAEEQMKSAAEKFGTEDVYSADVLGQLVGFAGKYFFTRCDAQDRLYADMENIYYSRHLGVAITGYQFHTRSVMGTTDYLDCGNFYTDLSYNRSTAVSLDGDPQKAREYFLETGMIESALEAEVWSDILGEDKPCVSTMHIFDAALEKGIEPVYITGNNVDEVLSECSIDSYIKDDVRECAKGGMLVVLIPEILKIGDWEGTGYISMDPETAYAYYMISDGTAGGASPDVDPSVLTSDDLMAMNVRLSYISRTLAVTSMALAGSKIVAAAEEGNIADLRSGFNSLIGGAVDYGCAVKMELTACDRLLDYADGTLNDKQLEAKLKKDAVQNIKVVLKQIIYLAEQAELVNLNPIISTILALDTLHDSTHEMIENGFNAADIWYVFDSINKIVP